MMLIRQAAFEGKAPLLKGNTHSHTTRSDGAVSPESTVRHYAAMDYDFLALTDHRLYNYQSYGAPEDLLILPGMELDVNMPPPGIHCVHLVSIGPEKRQGNGFGQDQSFDRFYVDTAAGATSTVDLIRKGGNVPILCHPEWSGTGAGEVAQVEGVSLMEIWNSGCAVAHGLDANAAYWDELLCSGKQIYGVASDDSHQPHQNGLGFVMVRAEKNPTAILNALEKGAFYSSCGPEIYDFYVENEKAFVICSPVSSIRFRYFRKPYPEMRSPGMTAFQQTICPGSNYIRAEVKDAQGRRAWTNPIFLPETYWKEMQA